jgi:hypothetical protein
VVPRCILYSTTDGPTPTQTGLCRISAALFDQLSLFFTFELVGLRGTRVVTLLGKRSATQGRSDCLCRLVSSEYGTCARMRA